MARLFSDVGPLIIHSSATFEEFKEGIHMATPDTFVAEKYRPNVTSPLLQEPAEGADPPPSLSSCKEDSKDGSKDTEQLRLPADPDFILRLH